MPSKTITKFTDNLIKGLELESKRYDVSCQGLVLRVGTSGIKTWVHVYRFNGKSGFRFTIGKYPNISLSQANQIITENLKLLAKGIEPNAHKKLIQSKQERDLTVEQLYTRYMSEYVRPKLAQRTIDDYEKEITKHILGAWRTLPAKKITRLDGITLLNDMVAKGRISEAGRVKAYLSGIWKFALNHEIIDNMPFSNLPKVYAPVTVLKSKPPKKQKRFFIDNEIYYFWHGTDKYCEPHVAATLKLMLLLGRRGSDVRPMLKSEIDVKNAIWHMTPGKVREEKKLDFIPIMLPLPKLAFDIIKERLAHATADDLMFPSPDIDCIGLPITQSALSQPITRGKYWNLPSWTPHDLRRSCSTGMSKLKIPQASIDQVLAHNMAPLAKVYNQDDFVDVRLEALEKWNDHIFKIVMGSEPRDEL